MFEGIQRNDLDGTNDKVFQSGEHFFESLYSGNLNKADVDSLFTDFYASIKDGGKDGSAAEDTKVAEDVISSSDLLYFDKKKVHIALQVAGTNPDESNGSTVYSLQVPGSDTDSHDRWIKL